MKRSNIDAMICKQEEITDITREAINKIQLDKLNAVLKKEKEKEVRVPSANRLQKMYFFGPNHRGYERD